MEIITAANTLRNQLVALENSEQYITKIGNKLKTLGRSYLRAEMADNQFQQLQLAVQLSTCEGVHQMFQTYSTHKQKQVQSIAATIKSCLEAGDTESMTTLMTSSMTSPPVAGSARPDRSVALWANIDSEMYRHH